MWTAEEAEAQSQRAKAGLRLLRGGPILGPPKRHGRIGSRLAHHRPDLFERMRVILGYYDLPAAAGKVAPKIEHVTISALQPLQYLDSATFTPEYRRRLAAYRLAGLNTELAGQMERTRTFLVDQQSGAGSDQDVVFRIPGM